MSTMKSETEHNELSSLNLLKDLFLENIIPISLMVSAINIFDYCDVNIGNKVKTINCHY